MTLSDLAVRRPVFAAVLAIMLCVIGFAAYFAIPVRELPNVDPPVISITTTYQGASAEVIEERITQIIESQVAGIQGIDRVNSSSRDGRSQVTITFTLDRSLDDAANDVRDAISRIAGRLPDQADPPTIFKANADSQPLISLGLTSTNMSRLDLSDYANRYLVERISTIPGIAQVFVNGALDYSMRIWLDPAAMAAHNVTVQDVEAALLAQNVELPAGDLESPNKDYTIRVARAYGTPAEFAALPVKAIAVAANPSNPLAPVRSALGSGDYVVRLGDVAKVEEGAAEPRRFFQRNGVDQLSINMIRQSQANDLDISAAVHKAVDTIQPTLPKGMHLTVIVDYTVFTSKAIHEVWVTMSISLILVALVNFVFLGSWRAALIPSIVAPICILSTFIILAPLGFSINLLTLLALVLAIGLVVDDAIVVVENIQRRIDAGEPPIIAAERGAKQVFFAVVATTVVLIAVFMPLMFLPGYIGRLFVELAVAVASAVAFSALLALSLSPMLSSKLLRPAATEGWLARKVEAGMGRLRDSYRDSLVMLLGHRRSAVAVGIGVAVLAAAAGGLFVALPKEVVPSEDRGRIDIAIQAPEGAGYDYTRKIALATEPIMQKLVDQGVADSYIIGVPQGFSASQYNVGGGAIVLTDWAKRKRSADDLTAELNRQFGAITGARVIASVRGPFQRGGGGGGGGGGQSLDFIASGPEYDQVQRWIEPIFEAAGRNPGLSRPRLDYEPTSPRLLVSIDRDKAAALGVSNQDIGRTLETMLGSRKATTYIKNGQEYDVIMQTQLESRRTEHDLDNLYVRTTTGETVPLSSVVQTRIQGDTPNRQRVDRLRSITLTAQLNPGYAVGDAIAFFRAEAAKQPGGIVVQWGGQAKDYLEASGAVGLAFGLALLLVFLVLAAQFESFIHPAVIMTTVPLAALGGLFALLMAGSSLNTYSEIGLIILIGIAAKNGILIVEFANQLRDQGLSVREAVIEAASLRLRPIIMTSIAAAFGALPLVLASGPGAASRRTIGVVIFAGAIFSSMLTLFVAPVFYNLLARYTKSPDATAKVIEAYEHKTATPAQEALPRAAE